MGATDDSAEPQLYYAVVEDAARLRDGLGIMPAAALPVALLEPVAEPLEDLVSRYARTHNSPSLRSRRRSIFRA